MKTLRLLITKDCDRYCPGCCNKQWDLDTLEQVQDTEYSQYDEIMLTGGEPMLDAWWTWYIIKDIHNKAPDAKLYMYTAKINDLFRLLTLINILDGITVTLHTQHDVGDFLKLDATLGYCRSDIRSKSFRLNVFKGISILKPAPLWLIKSDIEWIENFPLPENEVFKRL